MEQDFLGLSSDFKRIRPSTLQALTLPEGIVTSIKSFMNEIKQKQQEDKIPKSAAAKNKNNAKAESQKKTNKRKCTLLLRGSSIVKKVLLEKVSCPKAQRKTLIVNPASENQNGEVDFEFISTPFNEEIPPIKVAKLQKYHNTLLLKEPAQTQSQPQPQTSAPTQAQIHAQAAQAQLQAQVQAHNFMKPPQPQPFPSWGEMPYFPYFPKNVMRVPMDAQNQAKDNLFWMGAVPPVRDNMNLTISPNMSMTMNMFAQNPVLMPKPPNHTQTFLDLS